MAKQIIVSISREFGSNGHRMGRKLAEDLGVKLYDRNMLDEIAQAKSIKVEYLEKYEEKPRNFMLSRRVGAYSNSMEEIVADMQFEYLREKAESGESFVVVGRCSETVLREYKGLISIFVTGDKQVKIDRVMEKYNLSEAEAITKMKRHDKTRKQYHNRHSDFKWGDSRNYDVCINSSKLGWEKTSELLEEYIRERMKADRR